MLGGSEREHGVLLDDHDRRAGLVHQPQRVEDLAHGRRREPERRLVEQEQPRLRHHRASERQHLLLAARKSPCALRTPLVEQREGLEHAGEIPLRRAAFRPRPEAQIVEHRQRGEGAAPFGHVGDAATSHRLRCAVKDPAAFEDHLARRSHEARDRTQRGRLAGAVRAENRDEVAVFDAQVDAVERPRLAVARLDVSKLKERHAVVPAVTPRSARRRGTPRSPRGSAVPRRVCPRRSCVRSRARGSARRCPSRGPCGARPGGPSGRSRRGAS